jgi:hypothetical protein
VSPIAIVAQITGSNRCDAEGLTVTSHVPVLAMCRKLIDAGFDPARPLHAYRGDVLCLTVSSIGWGAKYSVDESPSPHLVRWRPFSSRVGASRIVPAEVDPPTKRLLSGTPSVIRKRKLTTEAGLSSPAPN